MQKIDSDLLRTWESLIDGEDLPLFIRGTSIDEAMWILSGGNIKYPLTPKGVLAWPLTESFCKRRIKTQPPLVPIDIYLTESTVNEAIEWGTDHLRYSERMGVINPDNDPSHPRLGVLLGFGEKVLEQRIEVDNCFSKIDPDFFYAAYIPLLRNPNPAWVKSITFLGSGDINTFINHFSFDGEIPRSTFRNHNEYGWFRYCNLRLHSYPIFSLINPYNPIKKQNIGVTFEYVK